MSDPRSVTIIGNFPLDEQQSMLRFGKLMQEGYTNRRIESQTISPNPVFTRLLPKYSYSGIPKLIGYLDKFVLFPRTLRKHALSATEDTIFHIADHSNSIYIDALPANRTFITCHDLLQVKSAIFHNPKNKLSPSGVKYQKWIARKLGEIKNVVCISTKTLNDYESIIPASGNRNVATILQCYNDSFSKVDTAAATPHLMKLSLDPETQYILHVGGNQWYKNRNGVIEIFAKLQKLDFPIKQLVMAGKPLTTEHRNRIGELGISNKVVNPSNVSSAQLRSLYSTASALLFPSLEEGFGWPIIEALACQCPAITSDRQPMREVAGDAAIYIDPEDVEESARKIMSSWSERTNLASNFQSRIEYFSEDRLISDYIEFMDTLQTRTKSTS